MSGKGYIRLHRQIQDCWIWDSDEKHNRRSAWIDLLLLANHSDKKIPFNDQVITIKRGQLLTSIRKLADRWHWSKSTVVTFLKLLENDSMILRDSDNNRTLLTIVNYEVYQIAETPNETPTSTPSGTPTSTVAETNNNDKECKKNEQDIYIAHFEETWKIYPKKKDKGAAYKAYMARINSGFSEDELLVATRGYAEECKREGRPEKYIKNGSTFFGVNTPFIDYLPKGQVDAELKDGFYEYPIDEYYEADPPYFGFPKAWFENGVLQIDRMKPIRQLPNIKFGTNKPTDYTVEQLKQKYNERRSWYEQENNG